MQIAAQLGPDPAPSVPDPVAVARDPVAIARGPRSGAPRPIEAKNAAKTAIYGPSRAAGGPLDWRA